MRVGRRGAPPQPVPVEPGERVLAWCEAEDGTVVAGTRDALYLTGDPGVRVPWELVEAADWDRDTSTLRVSEVGTWGEERPVHELVLAEPQRLLELLRERVTASIVLQRHVPVERRGGLRVIARRAPRGHLPLFWVFEYDEGVDPEDPEVQELRRQALAAAHAEVGS